MLKTPLKAILLVLLTLATVSSAVPVCAASMPANVVQAGTPDFSVSVSPATESRKRGTGAVYDITITSLNGFSGTIQETITGAPPATTGDGTASFNLAAGQTLFLSHIFQTHKVTTPIGTFTLTFTYTSGNITHTVQTILKTL
ncbi:MAG TPA: hypothetical protein VKZ53_23195 [Candidatus Angelobacter sp.]|nr:hypothetical protein [Candidatus Angelobacter sp.]